MTTIATARPTTMTALRGDRYGEPLDVLALGETPVPTPAAGEVLVDVAAAGVDRGVWHLVVGHPYLARLAFGLTRPRQPVPGMDLVGVVVAVGEKVVGFAPGDRVFGVGTGTFAPYAVAPEKKLALVPDGVTDEQAAATPISGLTALQALRDAGRVERGQRVLVTGASGGVGTFAVQIAKHFGAEVTGVASASKLDLVRSLGADHVVDYASADPYDGTVQYDLILDIAGRPSLRRLRRALAPRGAALVCGGEDANRLTGGVGRQLRATLLSPFVSQRLGGFMSKELGFDVATLGELLASGAITASIDRVVGLADVPAVLDDMGAGRTRGKTVVRPDR